MDLKTKIGQRVAKARKESGFIQSDFAAMLNITRSSLVNIEKGRQKIEVTRLVHISRLTGFSIASIIDDTGETLESHSNNIELNFSYEVLNQLNNIPERHLKRFLTFYNQIKNYDKTF